MAEHALVSAGEMPHLPSHAALAGAVSNRIGAVHAKRVHQCRVRLLIIPDIGVADPTIVLLDHDARFDSFPGRRLALLHIERERFYGYGTILKFPRLVIVEDDLALVGHRDEALLMRSVRPKGSIDFVWNDSWRYLVLFS